jgi:hypothetical protein
MFARRVFDVRSEDIGQHLFPGCSCREETRPSSFTRQPQIVLQIRAEFGPLRQQAARYDPFTDRSVSRIDQLFAPNECSFLRELNSNMRATVPICSRKPGA